MQRAAATEGEERPPFFLSTIFFLQLQGKGGPSWWSSLLLISVETVECEQGDKPSLLSACTGRQVFACAGSAWKGSRASADEDGHCIYSTSHSGTPPTAALVTLHRPLIRTVRVHCAGENGRYSPEVAWRNPTNQPTKIADRAVCSNCLLHARRSTQNKLYLWIWRRLPGSEIYGSSWGFEFQNSKSISMIRREGRAVKINSKQ